MLVRITEAFQIDNPDGTRTNYAAGSVHDVDPETVRLWKSKDLAETDDEPPVIAPEPVGDMAWPDLQCLASDLSGHRVRSRADAERIVNESRENPDTAE